MGPCSDVAKIMQTVMQIMGVKYKLNYEFSFYLLINET